MFAKRKIATGVLSLVVALATGHVMQYGIAPEDHVESPAPRPSAARPNRGSRAMSANAAVPTTHFPAPVLEQGILTFPTAPEFEAATVSLPRAVLKLPEVPVDVSAAPPSDTALDLNAFGLPCDVAVSAMPADGGMIALAVEAGCDAGQQIRVAHAGLMFSQAADGVGQLRVDIPAMTNEALVTVTIGDTDHDVSVRVPEAGDYDRIALIWTGEPEISLHGVELGAEFGSGGRAASLSPTSGPPVSLVTLGDSDRATGDFAQVLSAPAGEISGAGVVRLAVRTEVTPFNCGRRIQAHALRSREGLHQDVTPLRIVMPGCASVGDILVLKNVLQDLKIARN